MFRVSQHPSSGVLKTVNGTGYNFGTATSLQLGLIRPRWREVSVPEAAVTVFSTPDDGCCDTRNMYNDFAVNKYLHAVASGWNFLLTLNCDARNHENVQKVLLNGIPFRLQWNIK